VLKIEWSSVKVEQLARVNGRSLFGLCQSKAEIMTSPETRLAPVGKNLKLSATGAAIVMPAIRRTFHIGWLSNGKPR
jgi:hypothetical protein